MAVVVVVIVVVGCAISAICHLAAELPAAAGLGDWDISNEDTGHVEDSLNV